MLYLLVAESSPVTKGVLMPNAIAKFGNVIDLAEKIKMLRKSQKCDGYWDTT
jgi:hypothetical protein